MPKTEGGLGIQNLSIWNETCGLKQIWMLFFHSGSVWVAWIRKAYLSSASFWSINEKSQRFSWMFQKLPRLRKKTLLFLSIDIGNGEDSFFWYDPWTPFGSLLKFVGPNEPARLGIPTDALVSDHISANGWILPPLRPEEHLQLYTFISQVSPSDFSDCAIWKIDEKIQNRFKSKDVWERIQVPNQSNPTMEKRINVYLQCTLLLPVGVMLSFGLEM
ncbi:uncharacterized protein LOC112082831 [Eutrema salsugineum]|uniref:uncharacterized protein LOC112082831 n=1 Tax=Eutrema salsugineum TaxID=72664 RepID=UPI000CECE594|nr:uncharacterized protein LOC112082831 [Eutrema salsugineum]